MKKICKITNTKKTLTTAYHPETDGLVERFNGTVTSMLSIYVSGIQRDWDNFLPYLMFAYRTSIHESTQENPFFLMHVLLNAWKTTRSPYRSSIMPSDTIILVY